MSKYLHEKTGLTAGTIAYDDELATDLGHLQGGKVSDHGSQSKAMQHSVILAEKYTQKMEHAGSGGEGVEGAEVRDGKGTSSGCPGGVGFGKGGRSYCEISTTGILRLKEVNLNRR